MHVARLEPRLNLRNLYDENLRALKIHALQVVLGHIGYFGFGIPSVFQTGDELVAHFVEIEPLNRFEALVFLQTQNERAATCIPKSAHALPNVFRQSALARFDFHLGVITSLLAQPCYCAFKRFWSHAATFSERLPAHSLVALYLLSIFYSL